jgi:DNA mismatch endonuclease (patch repair protein)
MGAKSPPASSRHSRKRMQAVRQRDTNFEMQLRSALHRLGLRFRIHRRIMPNRTRTADIVMPTARIAVFVDGCFWHSCPHHKSLPKANREWWRAKLAANIARDRHSDRALRRRGWRVIRIWEHEHIDKAAKRVLNASLESKPLRRANPGDVSSKSAQ